MKKIIILFITVTLVLSCGSETKKADLEELKTKKLTIVTKIDSLNGELQKIEKQISKIDKSKKLHVVTVLPVKHDVFKHFIEIQGVVQVDKNIEIRPELGGTVKAIYVKDGQRVSAGQSLLQLDDSAISNSITELNTQLSLANTTFDRQKRLWEQKIGSEMQFLQAKANKEGLENSLTSLKTQSSKMNITAPFAGIVDEIFPRNGELTSPQTPVIRLINLEDVYVEAAITETYLPVINVGTETLLYFPSLNKEIMSNISHVGNFINPDNRSFKTRINISNKDQLIKPNLLANLKILDFQIEGIIIPSTLIQKDQQGNSYVFTIQTENGESTVVKNIVTVENEYNNEVYISKGLNKNDKLVNAGARIVKAGDIVNITE